MKTQFWFLLNSRHFPFFFNCKKQRLCGNWNLERDSSSYLLCWFIWEYLPTADGEIETSGIRSLFLDSVIQLLSNRKSFPVCGKSLWQVLAVILFIYRPLKDRNSLFLFIKRPYMDYRDNIRFTKSVKVSELDERNTSHSSVSTNERLGCADYVISCCRRQSPSLGYTRKQKNLVLSSVCWRDIPEVRGLP